MYMTCFAGQSPARSVDQLSDGVRTIIDNATPRKNYLFFGYLK